LYEQPMTPRIPRGVMLGGELGGQLPLQGQFPALGLHWPVDGILSGPVVTLCHFSCPLFLRRCAVSLHDQPAIERM